MHGITGVEQVETSAGGRAMRKLASNPATPGNTVRLSLDIRLQKLVEDMFGDRRGALVALDPKTGDVLAFPARFASPLLLRALSRGCRVEPS